MTSNSSNGPSLSIGAVSNATDIPAATLRTWERRYGFPDPKRSEGGHRCYCTDDIERLRLIARALDRDHRPSDVVPMDPDDLRALLETAEGDAPSDDGDESEEPTGTAPSDNDMIAPVDPDRRPEVPTPTAELADRDEEPDWLVRWRQTVGDLDGESLQTEMETEWNRMGGIDFLEKRLAPLLVDIGHQWATGNLGLVHEHYASEHIQNFLSSRWRPISDRNQGPVAMCATLPGEDHVIGLHIAALVLAIAGWQVIFVGPRTPTRDLAEAADDAVDALVISFSQCYAPENADRAVATLRNQIPDSVDLVTGGQGAPEVDEAVSFSQLRPFYEWAQHRGD